MEAYPNLIIEKKKKDNTKIQNNKAENDSNDKNDKKDMEIEENQKFPIFVLAINFIAEYLDTICDKEFYEFFNINNKYNLNENQKFNNEYSLDPKIDSLYFHMLYFDLIVSIYSLFGNKYFEKSLINIFFEKKDKKRVKLFFFKKYCRFYYLKDKEKEKKIEIDFYDVSQVRDEEIIMINLKEEKETFIFNPYDYIFSNINDRVKSYQDIVNEFLNPNNFSLNKVYKDKMLFNNRKIFNAFNENIRLMLSSKTIGELYCQFVQYSGYNNPFQGEKKEKFIDQTLDIILYMPIPFSHIAGFTYKNFGIIFLNSKEINKKNATPNTYFLKKICNASFKKIVNIHEIICHYCSTLIHAHENETELLTPKNTFIGYDPMDEFENLFFSYDGGEKGESILFGNKIKYLFIEGALYTLDNTKFEQSMEHFRDNFIIANEPNNYKNIQFNVKTERNKNEIVNLIAEYCENIEEIIQFNASNSIFSFRVMNSFDDDNEEQIYENGVLFWERLPHKDITFKKRAIDI